MIELVENDKICIILAKDMSRIGRNYLEVGIYTEILFPEHNVRFIAVNSGVDSANQIDNDFTPFLNIMNEFYVKDSSKKVRAVMKQKGEAGEYLTTNPPYGYMKDPDNPKRHWIVDDEAAAVVRQIFAWCMEGYGPSQIAHKLKEEKVECPTVHWMKLGRNAPAKTPDDPYGWVPDTVSGILEKQEYLGHTVNFKTHRLSYKSKKKLETPPINGRFSRTPLKRLLMKIPLPVCRNFARTNADLPEQAKPICSPVPLAVPIVVRNCTTAPAKALKPDKTTSFAPPPVNVAKMYAKHISSVRLCWRKEPYSICVWYSSALQTMKMLFVRHWEQKGVQRLRKNLQPRKERCKSPKTVWLNWTSYSRCAERYGAGRICPCTGHFQRAEDTEC